MNAGVIGEHAPLPFFANPKDREAERVAFFQRAWAQKNAREAAAVSATLTSEVKATLTSSESGEDSD